uniref:RAB42, member RAS oncogene family a n=1 Tax=Monopterus albus TaxID=43700 RepID=A0A3Q3J2T4_MONAL
IALIKRCLSQHLCSQKLHFTRNVFTVTNCHFTSTFDRLVPLSTTTDFTVHCKSKVSRECRSPKGIAWSITTSYYRNSVGGLLVFDLTNRKTFDHVREWHKEVSEHILPHHMVYILIGHKSDLNKERKVSRDEAEHLAAELGIRYVETSAKCNSNVDRAFELLTRDIYELMKMGEIVTRDGWDGVKSGLTAKVLFPAEDEEELATAATEKGCHC